MLRGYAWRRPWDSTRMKPLICLFAPLPVPLRRLRGNDGWVWVPIGIFGQALGQGWITVGVRLITKASWRSRKSATTSVNASGRSVLIACPAS